MWACTWVKGASSTPPPTRRPWSGKTAWRTLTGSSSTKARAGPSDPGPRRPRPARGPAGRHPGGRDLSDPVTLFPHRATDLVSQAIVANASDTLVRQRGEAGRLEAALATTWATPDHRAWTFTLREGVRFHDGAPPRRGRRGGATSRACARCAAFPAWPSASARWWCASLLDRPNAALLSTLSQPYYAMQSPRALDERGGRPVGTGPFRLAASPPGLIELAANPELLGRRPAPAPRRLPALSAGRTPWWPPSWPATSTSPRPSARAGWTPSGRTPGLSLDSFTGLNVAFLSVNNERRALERRRASGRPCHGPSTARPWWPGSWAATASPPEARCRPRCFGPPPHPGPRPRPAGRAAPARRGRLPEGFETTLLAVDSPRPYMPTPLRLAGALREQLAAVGIRATLHGGLLDRIPTSRDTRRLRPGGPGMAGGLHRPERLPERARLGRRDRLHQPQPLPERRDGRASEAGPPGERPRGARGRSIARPRSSSRRTCRACRSTTCPSSPRFAASVHGFVPGRTGLLRYDKTWKTE